MIVQQPVAQLPWGHVTVLLDKLEDQEEQDFYSSTAVACGWSRAVLTHHISTGLHQRSGGAVMNYPTTLGPESDLVTEILEHPYDLHFLALGPGCNERHLEDALVARLTHFLAELGEGFEFVGRHTASPSMGRTSSPTCCCFTSVCAGTSCSSSRSAPPPPSTWGN